ncbi:uncharacterized protein LOC143463252 [Clavelina lepadiformis]|uniref:uncharacterized protein LOC143463252 n=1 Tax=Clavelina lepadiformis TaxID=159417 RepID=UPI0040425A45
MEKFSAAFTCLMFGIFVTKVASIECYDCGYRFTNGCEGGNITEEFLKSCPVGYDYCVTRYLKGTNWLIGRGCSTAAVNTCIQEQGSTFCYKACSTDNCNDDKLPLQPQTTTTKPASQPAKCYQCRYQTIDGISVGDDDCKRPSANNLSLTSCDNGRIHCLTSTYVGYNFDGNKTTGISRACTDTSRSYNCYSYLGSIGCTSTCNSDGCNDDSVEDHQSQLASERIKCYQCAYSSDSGENGCNNLSNISSKYLNNCPAGHKYCDTWNITSDRNQTVISRGCSVEDRDFCFILGEDSACISTCDTDGCNSGDTIRSGIMACITATIVFLFYV